MYELKKIEVTKNTSSYCYEYTKFFRDIKNIIKRDNLDISIANYIKENNLEYTGQKYLDDGNEFREGYKYIVYALTKPNCNKIYIGITSISLQYRYSEHLKQSKTFRKILIKVNNNEPLTEFENGCFIAHNKNMWFDKLVDINLVKLTDDINDEKIIIDFYKKHPDYELLNEYQYDTFNDPEGAYQKLLEKAKIYRSQEVNIEKARIYNQQEHIKEYKKNYQKTSQHAKEYRSEYYKYYNKAKKLGMSVEQYKKSLNNGN